WEYFAQSSNGVEIVAESGDEGATGCPFRQPQIADEPHIFAWGSSFVATTGRDRDFFRLSPHHGVLPS
ncbi:hypothetical protein, partial [Klebsiella indica]|uniref:hypothetical protein n=1 Tax=Klebsiella indica TaxID=2582917 RepID=UPI0019D684A0